MNKILLALIGVSCLTWSGFSEQGAIVKDSDTQLEWQNNYRGEITELYWEDAIGYCQNLELNGNGWRLPSKSELISLFDKDENVGSSNKNMTCSENSKPILNKVFLNHEITGFDYWSSSITNEESNLRWGVNFKYGWTGRYTKYYALKVRCVRGKLMDNLPIAKTFGTVGEESKPFSDETEGTIAVLEF